MCGTRARANRNSIAPKQFATQEAAMPKRVIDFDAMWASDKLAACAEWAQAEYAWLYGLADCAGCFELTNLRVIWGRVAAIRKNFSIERLEQVIDEFHDQRLLFIWVENGKRYGHWTGSDVPGRLPPPSWRNRLERLAPPVPRDELEKFLSHRDATQSECARGAIPLRESSFALSRSVEAMQLVENADRGAGVAAIKPRLEAAPAQDLNLGLDLEGKWSEKTHTECVEGEKCVESPPQPSEQIHAGESKPLFPEEEKTKGSGLEGNSKTNSKANSKANSNANSKAEPPQGHPDKSERTLSYADALTPEALGEIWEQERGTLPEMRGLTPDRVVRCRERIRNATQSAQFVADFREAVRRAAATPFLCGEGPGGWRANFDWIVANDTNYLKVLEGRYDAGSGGTGCGPLHHNPPGASENWSARAVSRDESARRMVRAGAGPEAPSSVRVRADVLHRATHRA
jgi:hypothetical protein